MPAKKRVAAKKRKKSFSKDMYVYRTCMARWADYIVADNKPRKTTTGVVSDYNTSVVIVMCRGEAEAFGFKVSGNSIKPIRITVTEI